MVSVEDCGDKNGENNEAHKLSTKIVGIFAIIITIIEGPEEGRSNGNFDMLPSGLVYRSKKTDGAMFSGKIIEEVRKSTHGRDGDNANPHDEGAIHEYIIA